MLLGYRRAQLGLSFSRPLLREMNHFGLPLVPAALALIAINFGDRFFLVHLAGFGGRPLRDRGADRVGDGAADDCLPMAWPAFAYSIEDDREAKRTYAFVLTYLVVIASWLALGSVAALPLVRAPAPTPPFYEGGRVVALLAFAGVAVRGYIVMAIGVGRAKRTQFNWVITGAAAAINIGINLVLVPEYGMIGSASRPRRRTRRVPRHDLVRATRLPHAVPVAPRGHVPAPPALTVHREGVRRPRRRDPARRRLPARAPPPRLLAAGRSGQAASSPVTYMIAMPARKPPIT